jgi:hypothetical protein
VDELVAAPLAGLTLAPAESGFVVGEWTDEAGWSSAEGPVAPPHASDGASRYLIVMTRKIQQLIDELHETHFATVAETFRKYDSELVA